MRQQLKKALGHFGYEIHLVRRHAQQPGSREPQASLTDRFSVNPVWPLPRDESGPSPEVIRQEFAKYEDWHYAYEFQGGLSFSRRYKQNGLGSQPKLDRRRPLQRFRHFMPSLLEANHGSLKGKRVLDIASNSGFWSLQFALLGAEVVGFDARPDLIEQANLIKRIVGAKNVNFQVLDFWDMRPESLGGKFDVVLCLGILYHLPWPIDALRLVKSMSREHILVDTEVYPAPDSVVHLRWEEPNDIRNANRTGIVAAPSKRGIEMILREIGVVESFEIPLRATDMPQDYLDQRRASWLIKV